jgi:hypothetical protein
MFSRVTPRTKVLIGMALGCAGWIVMMPDTSQTIEPTRGTASGPSTRAPRAVPSTRKLPIDNASFRMPDRIVKDTAAAALFSAQSWYVAPPAPPPAPVVAQPPPVPTAPPLPFAFMGSYRADGTATYFLTAGDRVYDVKIGDTLDNTYSVDGVKSGQLLFTYMPLKIQQSLAVGEER